MTPRLGPLSRRAVLGGAAGLLAGCSSYSPEAVTGTQTAQRLTTPPQPTTPTGPITLAYGAGPSQVGDLHLPAGAGPIPVVVVIHGGYWTTSYGKELGTPLAADLVRAGVAVWNIEYRRVGAGPAGGGGWPATFEDVATAIDALAVIAQRAAGDRLDLTRVTAVGHSAGGTLALWAAGRPTLPAAAPGAQPVVHLVSAVSQAGVNDLVGGSRARLGGGAVDALLGGAPATVPERYALASPLARLPLGVPATLVHGSQDSIVPIAQSEVYAAAARRAGDHVTLVRVPGADHFALIDPTAEAWRDCRTAALTAVGVPAS